MAMTIDEKSEPIPHFNHFQSSGNPSNTTGQHGTKKFDFFCTSLKLRYLCILETRFVHMVVPTDVAQPS